MPARMGALPAQVVAVISNKAEAFGLERARRAGVPAIYLPKPKEEDRRDYDAVWPSGGRIPAGLGGPGRMDAGAVDRLF